MNVGVDVGVLLPALAPAVAAALVLVVDIAAPRHRRVHYVLALAALVVGAYGTVAGLGAVAGDARRTLCLASGDCLYAAGAVASALQLAALLAAAVVLLIAWPEESPDREGPAVEVSLVLAAAAGGVAVAAAADLGSWLVSLELATLPVVALVALRRTATAVAGAVTLLMTALVSFALLALAAALWYAATGSAMLDQAAVLSAAAEPGRRGVLVLAVVLVVAGVGFKLSLVPFHAWTPEAYSGAPLPVALFLAGTSKVAALAALLVVVRAVAVLGAPVLTAVAVVAAVSMTLGNVVALRQDDAVRLLAWSTVAQAGWVVLPLAAVSSGAAQASTMYLLAYTVATVVAFVVVAAVVATVGTRRGRELTTYRGLLRTRPFLGTALALALLSLAGLPPGVVGVVAKVAALRPVVADQMWLLAVVAAVNVVVGVAVYLRWLVLLVAAPEPVGEREAAQLRRPRATHPSTVVALGVAAGVLVLTSLSPQLVLGLLGP